MAPIATRAFASGAATDPALAAGQVVTDTVAAAVSTLYLPAVQTSTVLYLPVVQTSNNRLQTPWPVDGAVGQSPNAYLQWAVAGGAPPGTRYSVYLAAGKLTPGSLIATDLLRASFDPPTFELDTRYYWQVIAVDDAGELFIGPVWTFRTEALQRPPAVDAMVTVPEGEFLMGCDASLGIGERCAPAQLPLHAVWLSRFEIDKYEVTNRQYRECVTSGACDPPRRNYSTTRPRYYNDLTYDYYPVLFVSWWNAQDYCHWAGKRLPTEAEWEKAARGSIDTRIWPWGNEDPDCTRVANWNLVGLPGGDACQRDTVEVGLSGRGASPYGVMDMGGNAFEWVADKVGWRYYRSSPYYNPINTGEESPYFIIRGGSFRDRPRYMRTFNRHYGHHGDVAWEDAPYYRSARVGFRCARSLP